MISQNSIKSLLEKYHARPSKLMGQNFLTDEKILDKIIQAARLTKEDTVLEIGPGIGTLTQSLSKNAGKVIAIEKDATMVEILKETLKDCNNVEVIQGDALKFVHSALPKNYKVVANIPYYLTSHIIRKFLEEKNQPELIILMIQKEVAQRICAKVPDMSLLAISVQFYAKANIISTVSKGCFWPSPKVDSAIIEIIPHKDKLPVPAELFFAVVKAGFLAPRKQLINNLCKGLKKNKEQINDWLLKNNIQPAQRAETLSIPDWVNLAKTLP